VANAVKYWGSLNPILYSYPAALLYFLMMQKLVVVNKRSWIKYLFASTISHNQYSLVQVYVELIWKMEH